ncbi:hypothetical protein [Brachybacterium sp.]|uniref:hypothetical protein n=1 Tax=Brachybacterium sp. TaxID=1891286 RepID=UPI002ED32C81
MRDDMTDLLGTRAMTLTPEQCEEYEDEALAYFIGDPDANDEGLHAILDRIQAR